MVASGWLVLCSDGEVTRCAANRFPLAALWGHPFACFASFLAFFLFLGTGGWAHSAFVLRTLGHFLPITLSGEYACLWVRSDSALLNRETLCPNPETFVPNF